MKMPSETLTGGIEKADLIISDLIILCKGFWKGWDNTSFST